ncbi:MAG TPA: YqcC family protein [Porticoccaceae bacterium]|nr:YqcC family protein [Porticoccaceae bacterium]HIG67546.1 YqcC family protein [Porticoccaceae bacterium]HIK79623.1 YqcC family protein [Porticoccaceae bacterium]
MDTYQQLSDMLKTLEEGLQSEELWLAQTPSNDALSSVEPFAVDTLTFIQWLQFLFLPRIKQICQETAELPKVCSIAPMAEEYFKSIQINGDTIVSQLIQIDQLITNA